MKTVKDYIRTIPDFPHAGILFRDVTTLFADARGFRSFANYRIRILFHCGKLDLRPVLTPQS